MNNDHYYIPKYLDEPPRWLFWTMDEAIVLIAPLLLGLIVFNRLILGFVLGVILMVILKKLKGSRGPHFLLSHFYWYFPFNDKYLKATPPSYIREYLG
jgi:conjugal transfer pilus assembly protein TraL